MPKKTSSEPPARNAVSKKSKKHPDLKPDWAAVDRPACLCPDPSPGCAVKCGPQRYNQHDYVYGTQPNDFIVSVAASLPRGKLLSLGEGEGRNAVYLASLGFEVTAIDSSEIGLAAEKVKTAFIKLR